MAPSRPNEIDYLTGRLWDAPFPPWVSLEGRGGKFTTDGRVQIWPGNTFICHVDRNSEAFEAHSRATGGVEDEGISEVLYLPAARKLSRDSVPGVSRPRPNQAQDGPPACLETIHVTTQPMPCLAALTELRCPSATACALPGSLVGAA